MPSERLSVGFRVGLAFLAALAVAPPRPVAAQGFLDGLFGDEAPVSPRPAAGYVRRQPLASSATSPYWRPFGLFSPYRADDGYDQLPPPDRTTYRTLCVRMCDGFYFPISHAASSAALTRHAEECTAACGGDARHFYHANPGGDVEDMVDLTGRAYASYPTAFRYRKTLVKGCRCRPNPWSETERARHRAYATAQAPSIGPLQSGTPAADALAASGPPEDGAADPAPQPFDRDTLETAAPSPALSPYVATTPSPVAARRNPRVDAGQWGWLSGEAGTGSGRRRPAQPWNSGR
jgi:hypothetical protein